LEYVSKIEMSALKLDKIIKDINSFSKTTYQRVKNDKIEFEQLIWKVINNYQNDQHFKRIDFEVKMTSKFAFYSDRDRIETIIDGIIRNAIHFMDVNKTRPFVRVDVKVDHQEVRVEVIDNGVGIAKQHHDKIFNMFYKASLNSRGAGLGLYIVKEGLEQLHGSVEVDSEVGFGSVFRLQIPNGQQIKSVWA
ncbi:MAG: sensor histidine kinase, partial [Bacteroidota bacterium]